MTSGARWFGGGLRRLSVKRHTWGETSLSAASCHPSRLLSTPVAPRRPPPLLAPSSLPQGATSGLIPLRLKPEQNERPGSLTQGRQADSSHTPAPTSSSSPGSLTQGRQADSDHTPAPTSSSSPGSLTQGRQADSDHTPAPVSSSSPGSLPQGWQADSAHTPAPTSSSSTVLRHPSELLPRFKFNLGQTSGQHRLVGMGPHVSSHPFPEGENIRSASFYGVFGDRRLSDIVQATLVTSVLFRQQVDLRAASPGSIGGASVLLFCSGSRSILEQGDVKRRKT